MLELFTSVADALVSYAIDRLDPAERLKSWLRLDPARLAFKKALARAYSAFARQYPEYTSSLFDQSFLSTDAVPEISKLLTRDQHPDPALLAQAWGHSLGANADFAQTATKPAAYFLERFEAELKAEPALQSLFDSRALESLPKLEADIQLLTADLQRGLNEALKAAQNYQQTTIHIGGDVIGDGIIIGNNNQLTVNKYYYSGEFVSLNEYYIPPDGVFQRVSVDEFVGRDWLTAKVDAFLNDPSQKSGAFLLVGDAGVGKTAFMAHLVKERRYLHLFAEQVPGQAMLQRALQSLGSQLVTRYQIDPYKDRDTLNVLAGFPDFLERLLRLAASTLTEGEKIVIVCDALDEAGVFPDHFVFGLPKELPDGVYLILSQRPVNTKLPNFEPLRFDLEAQGEDNLQDMEAYLSAVAKRPAVVRQMRAKDYSEEFFIQTLKEKSLGVWMYLHYVIKEIERGQRAPLDLESLPKGLVGYYADYWDSWRSGRKGSDAAKWDSLYAPLLATLAAAQEAITVEKLIEWAGVQTNSNQVTRLLSELWGSFITEKEEKDKTVYTLYHQSLRDFITGKVDDIKKLPPTYASLVNELSKKKVDAHQRIVNAFEVECNGEWEKLVEQDYPRLHLTAHLNDARELEKLRILLTEGNEKIRWAEVREKKEETYAGYLNDLTYVWDYAEQEQNYALAIRCMLIENSIHSLASNISPEFLVQLGKTGLWSYARCLSTIRENPDSITQANSLKLIIPELPPLLLQDALITAREVKDEEWRASVLALLIPYLNGESKTRAIQEALATARNIQDKFSRARSLVDLDSYLDEESKTQVIQEALATARDIPDDFGVNNSANALAALAPHLGENSKAQAQALAAAYQINNNYARASVLIALAPYLNEENKTQALAAARQIENDLRANVLIALAPHLDEENKEQAIQEALIAAYQIKDESDRASVLIALAPHLDEENKEQAIQEALIAAYQIKNESDRASVLIALAPYLDEESKAQALQEASIAARQIENDFRANVLIALAPHLDEESKALALQEALAMVREIKGKSDRAYSLATLAQHLDEESKVQVLQEALATVCQIKRESERVHVLAHLVPYLNKESKAQVLQETLVAAHHINDNEELVKVLLALAPHVNEESRAQILQEALAEARQIKVERDRVDAFMDIAPYLDEVSKAQVLQEALVAARQIEHENPRAVALTRLALYLDEKDKTQAFHEALAAARQIKNDLRANVLIALAPHLDEENKEQAIQEALIAAYQIIEFDHASLLKTLIPFLNEEFKAQAFAAVQKINNEEVRATALKTLAPHLGKESKAQALAAAC